MPKPAIFIEPRRSSVGVDETFNVNVNVEDVVGLMAWEFILKYDPYLLYIDETMIAEGTFLKNSGTTMFLPTFLNGISLSYLQIGCSLYESLISSGEGILAILTFKAIQKGKGNLELFDTQLLDSNIDPIRHNVRDGSFHIK